MEIGEPLKGAIERYIKYVIGAEVENNGFTFDMLIDYVKNVFNGKENYDDSNNPKGSKFIFLVGVKVPSSATQMVADYFINRGNAVILNLVDVMIHQDPTNLKARLKIVVEKMNASDEKATIQVIVLP